MSRVTNTQLYVLPAIALIIAIVALIMAFVAEFKHTSLSVLPANGFSGKVDDNILTLQTSVNGMVASSAGSFIPATNELQTAALLTGLIPTDTTYLVNDPSIIPSDSILRAMQKINGFFGTNPNIMFTITASFTNTQINGMF